MKTNIEKEVKFEVLDINSTIEKILKVAKHSDTRYIRDIIYGAIDHKSKVRIRIENNFKKVSVEAIFKYKAKCEDDDCLKIEVEEEIYHGDSLKDALIEIKKHGKFKEENSYEKTRIIYVTKKAEITLDIYPYGVWIEIEAEPKEIWELARKLGFSKKQAISKNADELYLDWNKKVGLKEMWDVRFGLKGKK